MNAGPSIPNVGDLMLASFPPQSLSAGISPLNPWWMGEKYDGIRVCWNPEYQKLYHICL